MWTKVTKTIGGKGATARTSFAVSRSLLSSNSAALVVPHDYVTGTRADIYTDGNGKLAFRMGDRGEYTVGKAGPKSLAKKIQIPAKFAHMVPYGTTDAQVVYDGGMLVLDTAQFAA